MHRYISILNVIDPILFLQLSKTFIQCMLDIDIVHEFPYIEIVINMGSSDYGFNREVIITDRITSAVTRRHHINNKVSNLEIEEEISRKSPIPSYASSSESRYARITFQEIEEPSHYNWVALIGFSLALCSTIQGICESVLMYLGLDHSGIPEHRDIPAYGHLILAYLFLFNAILMLALWFCENVLFMVLVWIFSIISWILCTWLALNNYGSNMLQLIWKSFQESSSTYDKIMVASWTRSLDEGSGSEKFIFPDNKLMGLACAQNGSVLCINLLLIFCIATTMALFLDFQNELKDSSSASSVAPIKASNKANDLQEDNDKQIKIFGIIGVLFVFFGLFGNFSLFIINNLYVYSSMHDSQGTYEVYTGGPRYAIFFGLTTAGLLSILYYMTYSKWVKFILFIFSIASLGCAIYSVFALRVWYEERLSEDGIYTEIRDCSMIPHQDNNEFCVFNCTFVQSTNSNPQHERTVECNEQCIPLGSIRKLHMLYI